MVDNDKGKKDLDLSDPKVQAKYFKALFKEQKKKNAKLQEEITEVMGRLKRAEEDLLEKSTHGSEQEVATTSAKDKELIASLQNELDKLKEDLVMCKVKSAEAEAELDKVKGEQNGMIADYTSRINELCQKLAAETSKTTQDKNKMSATEKKMQDYKKLYEAAQSKLKVKPSAATGKLQEELEKYRQECEILTEKLEQTQVDQDLLNEQNRATKKIMEEEIAQLTQSMSQKDGEISTLKSRCFELETTFTSLDKDNKEKEEETKKMKEEIKKYDEKMKKLDELVRSRNTLKEKLKESEREVSELKSTIEKNESEIK
eukprot:TRINITY_DN9179_c0_g1_i2.p1 TRINITY_DN9179_c0_g1~~TRINITY_DN9179_c0_g1_i2.p1  ORF type:complete len:316 (+),score=163.68 TRINITY_DN9179_c0_g1_i2:235-1182(+)